MNQATLLSLLASSAFIGQALAGTAPAPSGKNPPPVTPAPESSMVTGSVTLEYDTNYVYRGWEPLDSGGHKAKNLVSGDLDLNFAVAPNLNWNFNAWYASSASANYDELDLYTRLNYTIGMVAFGPSFKYYYYPHYSSGIANQYEVGLEATITPIENLAINLGGFYEFEAHQWYFQVDTNYTIKINDWLSLVPGATVSYVDVNSSTFGLDENDFHHIGVYLKAPIKLSKTVSLVPYVAGNFPIGDQVKDWQDNIIFGGASLSVSF